MPYIPQDLYNSLINSDLEQSLKDALLDIQSEETSTQNLCSVRILSNSEWERYIRTGTADGAIVKEDTKTWNFLYSDFQIFVNNWGNREYDKNAFIAKAKYTYRTYVENDDFVESCSLLMFNRGGGMREWGPIYLETITDNNSSNYQLTSNCKAFFGVNIEWPFQFYDGACDGNLLGRAFCYTTKNANLSKSSVSFTSTQYKDCVGQGWSNHYMTFYSCFRPVFMYKDNKKSLNIHL